MNIFSQKNIQKVTLKQLFFSVNEFKISLDLNYRSFKFID